MDKLTVITLAVCSFLFPIGYVLIQHQDQMAQQQTGGKPPGKVLFFTSSGCGACVRMQPTYDDLRMAGFPISKVDVNRNQQLAQEYRIRSIPTFVYVVDGQEQRRITGTTSKDRLKGIARSGWGF